MNKKLFLGMFAAAGMLFATSCSNDELDPVQSSSDQAQVTFSLGLEGGMATRAISDGTGAKKLVYAVYKLDAQNNPVLQPVVGSDANSQFVDGEAFDNGLTETVSVTLAKGQTYQIAFWAQDGDCKAYNTADLTSVKVSYKAENSTDNAANNDELRDAFFKTVQFTVEGDKVIDNIFLKRVFAQINVGVYKSDWEAAVKSGIEIEKSSVVIKNAATSINLLTGEVGDERTDVVVSYSAKKIPAEDLKVDLNNDGDFNDKDEMYKWLSMSYILVADRNADSGNGVLGDERSALESLTYTFVPKSGNNITIDNGLNNIPVQRNWRTNILGKILTGDIQFNITIDPGYIGDYNSQEILEEVLKNGGEVTLFSDATLSDSFTIPAGKEVKINLNGNTLNVNSEVSINGNIDINNGNVNIDVAGEGDLKPAFLAQNGSTVSIDGVDMKVADKSAGVYVPSSNVAATINISNTAMDIDGQGHGVSATQGAKDLTINVAESTLKGTYAFYLMNTNSKVTIDEKSEIKDFWVMGGNIDVIYTGEKPEIKTDGLAVTINYFTSKAEFDLNKVFEEGGNIKLESDITISTPVTVAAGKEVTLDLNGKTITSSFAKGEGATINNNGTLKIIGGTVNSSANNGDAAINNSGTLVLDDVKINGAPLVDGGYSAYAVISSGKLTIEDGTQISAERGCVKLSGAGETIINGGTFTNVDIYPRNLTSHVVDVEDGGSNKLTINGGTFSHLHAATSGGVVICNRTTGTVFVNGGNFSGGNYYGNNNLSDYGYGGTFEVTGGTYTAKPADKYLKAGYKSIEKDGKYVIVPESVKAVVSSSSDLSSAIAAGNGSVILSADIEYSTDINNDASINLNGKTFEATNTINLVDNADLTMTGGKYVVNGTYGHIDVRPNSADGSVLVYENVDFSFNKLNPTNGPSTNRLGSVVEVCATATDAKTVIKFKNCTFDNAQVLFEGMSGKTGIFEAEFENCTFNALTSSAPIYVQNYVKGTISLIDCIFNLECTSSTASAVSVSSSSSTNVTVTAVNNTLNAVAATPYTFDASKGETQVHNIKVNGTPANIKFISAYSSNTTVNETNTTKTGIAQ